MGTEMTRQISFPISEDVYGKELKKQGFPEVPCSRVSPFMVVVREVTLKLMS